MGSGAPRLSDTTADVKAFLSAELAGGYTSLHFILSKALGALPNHLKPNFLSVTQSALKMHYLFGYKQCILCPSTRNSSETAKQCTIATCETLKTLLSPDDHARVTAEPSNHKRQTYPPAEGHVNSTEPQSGRQDSKRSRYDSDRKGQSSKQDTPAHIR